MSTRNVKFFYLVVTILLVLACVPTFAAPFPTADPNAVNTFIAQTADAASTRTAAAQPTSTLTPSITPTRPTETPSPTATATVIFILSTPTQVVIPTFTSVSSGGGGGGGGNDDDDEITSANYSCQVVSVSPANGTRFDPRADFDAVWRVRNNGQRNWDRNSIDFIYDSGDRIHKVAGYDLDANVSSGNTINLGADMEAPQNSGTYTTYWTLRVGDDEFCRMSLTINVR
jgi:hypothetical protein